jgi:hemoglobin
VTRAHFNALVEVLQQTMAVRGIPFQRQNQMLALLAPMYRDMVTTR